eukprot:CAMPEP_0113534948 /NCGR_PEP_ID=MMETSP0015_2-20120614/5429_1 /TAXON_ID=2838 /ORGANISM="Odontella" /LENGTH=261 /DNA_ID=CAMNT_0000434139 /DNA_START=158 /DNA_END=943 /DNA_ORIENTATION=- /assembly_acc=CAM_ASM_000160
MSWLFKTAVSILVIGATSGFSTLPASTAVRNDANRCYSSSRLDVSTRLRDRGQAGSSGSGRRPRPEPCPEPEDDPTLDRREAAFAMLGRLWAAGALPAVVLSSSAPPAIAEYGADAKMSLPNPLESIADRATKQCLVESLGNRECLVYLDPENKLYQGADAAILVERIEKASEALASIPPLVDDKCWSKVLGVITGPMGTLGTTMDQLQKISGGTGLAEKAKKVKTDLYAIAAAADRRQQAEALEYHKMATDDLVAFVKAL